jgi:predicted N-acetyltransferase YhbS
MTTEWTIRPATSNDAAAISRLVAQAVQRSNPKNYPPEIVAEVVRDLTPAGVAKRMHGRQTLVAVEDGKIVGTVCLDGAEVRSVFVLPGKQGRGVGKGLMRQLEEDAKAQGLTRLSVPAPLGADGFYRALGYVVADDDNPDGNQAAVRTVVLEKTL